MIEIFKFEHYEVRFVGTASDPWWVAKDICQILEIGNLSQALSRLDEDEKGYIILNDPLGNEKKYRTINESGLYSLILSSRKQVAKPFKKWVTSSVLPAIRKTGQYSINSTTQLSLETALALANFAASSAQNAGVSKPVVESIKLDSVMQCMPFAKPLLLPQKKAIVSANPIEEHLSPTEIGIRLAERLGIPKISARAVNKKLLSLNYQVSVTRIKKATGKEVHDYYKPTQKTIDGNYGHLELSSYKTGDAHSTKYQLRWRSGIIDLLVNNWWEHQ